MITVVFKNGVQTSVVGMLWQYDYGQILRIQGLDLPDAVEVDFSLDPQGGESVTRIGLTEDGVTDVAIPDSMLENDDTDSSYTLYAFVYLTDDDSGETRYQIALYVRARPERTGTAEEEAEEITDAWAYVIADLNEKYAEASAAATLSESYAVGGTDTRDGEDEDNAKYYAEQAAASAETAGDAAEEIKTATEAAKEEQAALEEATEKASAQQATLETATETAAERQTTLETATENAASQQSTLEAATEAAQATNSTLTETTESADTANTALTETVENANTANATLNEAIDKAETADETLTETINDAGTANAILTQTIDDAGTANAILTQTIDDAGTANTTLTETIDKADAANAELAGSTDAASELKDALDEMVEEVATEGTAQDILTLMQTFEEYLAAVAEATADAATETTAKAILALMEPLEGYLQIIAENSSATDLNGFGLELGGNGEVVLTYTDPDTEETESATLPTGTTQNEMLAAVEGIADNLSLIVGASDDAESEET